MRPEDLDPNHDPIDWADNWLSNFLAFVSYHVLPSWCSTPEHWTSRLTGYLFTDCPCCLLFRGIVVGIAISLVFFSISLGIASLL